MSKADNKYAHHGALFLDMDGVLCTQRAHYATKNIGVWAALDPLGIMMIKNLCDDFYLKIVASSTWRYYGDNHIDMRTVLASHGLGKQYFFSKDWKTIDLRTQFGQSKRGIEINKWLAKHPHVTRYIIFDDNQYDFMQEGLMKRFIRTHEDDGISSKNYEDARNKLRGMV